MKETFTAFITFFVPRVSSIPGSFGSEWNNHKLSTNGNRSPNQLFIQGMLDSNNEVKHNSAVTKSNRWQLHDREESERPKNSKYKHGTETYVFH